MTEFKTKNTTNDFKSIQISVHDTTLLRRVVIILIKGLIYKAIMNLYARLHTFFFNSSATPNSGVFVLNYE